MEINAQEAGDHLMRRSAVADRLELEDALIDWYVVWLPDAKEAAKRDKCPRSDYIAMHVHAAQVDAARAYDASEGRSMTEDKVHTITITPNYSAIFERFRVDAMNFLHRFAGSNHKSFTRKEVYDFVASMRIALCSATNIEEIVRLREGFDEGAERMFAVLMKEQEEADDADQR